VGFACTLAAQAGIESNEIPATIACTVSFLLYRKVQDLFSAGRTDFEYTRRLPPLGLCQSGHLPKLHRQGTDLSPAYLWGYLQTGASFNLEAVKAKPEKLAR
jgi:hypothetical protein